MIPYAQGFGYLQFFISSGSVVVAQRNNMTPTSNYHPSSELIVPRCCRQCLTSTLQLSTCTWSDRVGSTRLARSIVYFARCGFKPHGQSCYATGPAVVTDGHHPRRAKWPIHQVCKYKPLLLKLLLAVAPTKTIRGVASPPMPSRMECEPILSPRLWANPNNQEETAQKEYDAVGSRSRA